MTAVLIVAAILGVVILIVASPGSKVESAIKKTSEDSTPF